MGLEADLIATGTGVPGRANLFAGFVVEALVGRGVEFGLWSGEVESYSEFSSDFGMDGEGNSFTMRASGSSKTGLELVAGTTMSDVTMDPAGITIFKNVES